MAIYSPDDNQTEAVIPLQAYTIKYYVLILKFLFLLPNTSYSQKAEEFINRKEVKRILYNLAGDQMLGRDAMQVAVIEKAATFVQEEFHSIGLLFQPGFNNYRQTFLTKRLQRNKSEIVADGQVIPERNLVVATFDSAILVNNNTPIVRIGKDDDFKNLYFTYTKDASFKIILVDMAHQESFYYWQKKYNDYLKRPYNLFPPADGNAILVLNHNSAHNFNGQVIQAFVPHSFSNIIGVLPGKSKPEEIVIFSAHYDHIGILDAVEQDSIANGADDNASGTTALIQLAKYFKEADINERTLFFIAFTAEEYGMYGSRYFAQTWNKPEQIKAMVNIEMIGRLSGFGPKTAYLTGFNKSNMGQIMQHNLKKTPYRLLPDPYPSQNLFYRSDNAPFSHLGIPAHTVSTNQFDKDKIYHTVQDESNQLDVNHITNIIQLVATSTKSLVQGQDTPTRIVKTSSK